MQLFEKHGIKNIAYWTATDDPLKGKTLVYIISHPSREAATANWKAFSDDPEWKPSATTPKRTAKSSKRSTRPS